MSINAAALGLIKRSEGFVNHWYADPASGGEPFTCCFGHTSAAGEPHYTAEQTFTLAEGEAILLRDLASVEAAVRRLVHVSMNDNQFGALVSFVFNLGVGNFQASTLLKLLNAGNYAGAAAEFPKWNHAAGKVMPGLTIRRDAEMALFLPPVAGVSAIPATDMAQTPKLPPAAVPSGFWAQLIAFLVSILGKKVG